MIRALSCIAARNNTRIPVQTHGTTYFYKYVRNVCLQLAVYKAYGIKRESNMSYVRSCIKYYALLVPDFNWL